jgi:hypothetical protein
MKTLVWFGLASDTPKRQRHNRWERVGPALAVGLGVGIGMAVASALTDKWWAQLLIAVGIAGTIAATGSAAFAARPRG